VLTLMPGLTDRGLELKQVEHLQLGVTRDVTAILGSWVHPGWSDWPSSQPGCPATRWQGMNPCSREAPEPTAHGLLLLPVLPIAARSTRLDAGSRVGEADRTQRREAL
jgi:hypothetical protein